MSLLSRYSSVIQISIIAALGGFLFGYDTAVINGAVSAIASAETGFDLTPGMLGFAVASVLGGAAFGAAFAGIAASRWGRVRIMVIAAILFCLSAIGSGLAVSLIDFVFWRIVGGVGVGIAAVIAPAYIAEVAPAHIRGRLGSLQQLAIAFGLFASFVVNALIAYKAGSAEETFWFGITAWRWMLMAEIVPALLYGLMALRLPESPRYLVVQKREKEALKVLAEYTNDPDPQGRVTLIKKTVSQEDKVVYFKNVTAKGTLLAPVVWLALALSILSQFSGINIILYYASSLWNAVGFSSGLALIVPIGTTLLGILMTIVGMLFIDKVGRKKLLLIGSVGMAVSLAITGLIFYGAEQTETGLNLTGGMAWAALISAHLFYVFFCGTWGLTLWVVLGEIFPNKMRAAGIGIATFGNWIGNLAVTWSFPPMMASWGLGNTYLFYSVCCLVSIYVVLKYLPETNGMHLEDMESFEFQQERKQTRRVA